MRAAATVFMCCLGLAAPLASSAANAPPDLAIAREAYASNIALGDSLAGAPATPQQVAQATSLVEQGLAVCRARTAANARDAAAHALAGMLLCAAYRPVTAKAIVADEATGEVRKESVTVLRRGGAAEEGLAELRAAVRFAPDQPDYALDYAEALQICGNSAESVAQAAAVWERQPRLTPQQRTRAARLLAGAMREQGRAADEMRWLREVVAADPTDSAAQKRLAELVAQLPPAIAWQQYEAGMAAARQQSKPVFMEFSAAGCPWCAKLEQEVLNNPRVIELSQRFSCIRVDGDRRRDLDAVYGVDGFPTTVFLDSQGREMLRVVGYEPLDRYLADMQRALSAQ